MNFNAPEFLLFFPAVLLLCALVFRRERARDLVLLAASYFFYGSWNWKYLGLLLLSTAIDYGIGLRLAREQRPAARRILIVVTVAANLGILGLFKYYNFFLDVAGDVAGWFGSGLPFQPHHLLLPVGVSFYTFQSLSYTLDVYRGQIPAERSFVKFALFVSFFPQLVAGPIVRAADFLPQLHRAPVVDRRLFNEGLFRVFRGILKKVVLADLLANFAVDAVFARPAEFSSLDLVLALYAYAFQIYNDFSGYSDVAIGAAQMLGYKFDENFDRPYLAQNVREFWTRWHISLSTWLRDYLYIPLGGNRGSPLRTRWNLALTMLLGGLWHGARMNFLLWGAYHGLLLMFARNQDRHARGPVPLATRLRRRVTCFHLVLVGWLLFRVESMEHLGEWLAGVARLDGSTRLHPLFFVVLALAVAAHSFPQRPIAAFGERFARVHPALQGAVYAGLILFACAFTIEAPAFIYFQF